MDQVNRSAQSVHDEVDPIVCDVRIALGWLFERDRSTD
jgi:hypothetical protein